MESESNRLKDDTEKRAQALAAIKARAAITTGTQQKVKVEEVEDELTFIDDEMGFYVRMPSHGPSPSLASDFTTSAWKKWGDLERMKGVNRIMKVLEAFHRPTPSPALSESGEEMDMHINKRLEFIKQRLESIEKQLSLPILTQQMEDFLDGSIVLKTLGASQAVSLFASLETEILVGPP